MSNTTKESTTGRWFTIDGRPLPRSQNLVHLVDRLVRTETGARMSTAAFRTWLNEQDKPGDDPLSKCWSVVTPNGRKVAVKLAK